MGPRRSRPDGPVRPVAYQPESDTTLAVTGDSTVIAPPSAAPPIQAHARSRERRR